MYCVPCHGPRGDGDGALARALNSPPKDLTSRSYLGSVSDSYLTELIAQGGAAKHGQPMMPSWTSVLGRGDIAGVIVYLRSLEQE